MSSEPLPPPFVPTLGGAPADDVVIVGGGLSGAIGAVQLGRLGLAVTLIDLHAEPRPEFRAEQLVGPQVQRLADLGLLEGMTRQSRLSPLTLNGRLGRLVDRTAVDQFGVPYQAMVEAARAAIPGNVRRLTGRVSAVETSPGLQRVMLSSGQVVDARLVMLATGLSSVLSKRLGIESRTISRAHSLAIGFDVRLDGGTPGEVPSLIYYGEDTRDRIDYLALFAMHDVIRANLFCYQEPSGEWVRQFCREPKAELLAVMPGLSKLIGSFRVTSPVQVRSNDLRVADDPARDGVVLVGDAFQTPCPAAGTGIDRLLSDLDVLCGTHIPAWLRTPGMGRGKIAAFYRDPAKQAFDAECLRIARYRRAVSTRQSLWWTVHRKQVFFRRQMRALLASRRSNQTTGPSFVHPH